MEVPSAAGRILQEGNVIDVDSTSLHLNGDLFFDRLWWSWHVTKQYGVCDLSSGTPLSDISGFQPYELLMVAV